MRVRIRSSSRASPRHVSPVGSRETKTVPGAASAPIRLWMRCQPGGVRYEPASPPMPARAVETGHAAIASPPSNQVAIWRSASTTSRRSGKADGAPGRERPWRASSSARVELDSIGAVTRALCHIAQPRRYSLVPIFRTELRTGGDPADPQIERLPPTTSNSSRGGSTAGSSRGGNRADTRNTGDSHSRNSGSGCKAANRAIAVIAVADVLDGVGLADEAVEFWGRRGGSRA